MSSYRLRLHSRILHTPFQLLPSSSLPSYIPKPSLSHFNSTQLCFTHIRSLTYATPQLRSIPPGHAIKPFLLADIGEGITGCEIVKWLVAPNQDVAEFDPICEVQSDKATVEITSPFEGTIHQMFGAVGEVIKVGQPLCEIIVKQDGDVVSPPDSVTSPDTESNIVEPRVEPIQPQLHLNVPTKTSKAGLIHSTPAVRRLAKEHSIDIETITGTGKDQRITKEDVLLHLSRPSKFSNESFSPPSQSNLPPAPSITGSVRVPFNDVRQAMFRSMSKSLKIPHFGYSEQIDVTELERVRLELNSSSAELNPKPRLTLFSLLIKAMGHALRSEPIFRSTLGEPPCFVQRQAVDLSIALSSPQGLLTPLIPNVEQKTVYEIADHVRRLREFVDTFADPTRLPIFPEELGGNRPGTFTLSNIGVIGGTYTYPVIPPTGQLGIGAFGKVQVLPTYRPRDIAAATAAARGLDRDSCPEPEPRLMLFASFSADHRASNFIGLGI
ncbi:2-oxoacid dehydrogenases acyltransferase-domain-containing protein [Melampsora americana]|nr:2-oxoacid dehydrogenases acyltransferase-domain-containing protein [Melampsora americana]